MQGFRRLHICTVISKSFTPNAVRAPPFFNNFFKPSFEQVKRFTSPTSPSINLSSSFITSRFAYRHFPSKCLCKALNIPLRRFSYWNASLFRARLQQKIPQINPNFYSFQRNWRSRLHDLEPEHVVYGLIAANVAVYFLWGVADNKFMVENFMISLDNFKSGRLHTLLTSAFSHLDFGHLFSNMLGLYFFGINIGRSFGPEYLLKLYLAGAIGGSVLYLIHKAWMAASAPGQGPWVRDPSRIPGLGASGAVNAILLLDIFLNPKATIYFNLLIPIPAMVFGMFLIGKDMWMMFKGDRNISGSAHLGGAAVAAMAWLRIRNGRF